MSPGSCDCHSESADCREGTQICFHQVCKMSRQGGDGHERRRFLCSQVSRNGAQPTVQGQSGGTGGGWGGTWVRTFIVVFTGRGEGG